MSITYSFYFKGNDGKFYPLDSFGGSSKVAEGMDAQFGRNYPYEVSKPLTKADLKDILAFENERVKSSEERIQEYTQRRKDIGTWNNSVDDKLQAIFDLSDSIDEEKCDLSYYKRAIHFFEVLIGILDEAECSFACDPKSENLEPVRAEEYIYWEIS